MATLPTPEDKARMVLSIYAHFNARPGHALLTNNFMATHSKLGLVWQDVQDGISEAGNLGWIEDGPNGSLRLTDAGFKEM